MVRELMESVPALGKERFFLEELAWIVNQPSASALVDHANKAYKILLSLTPQPKYEVRAIFREGAGL